MILQKLQSIEQLGHWALCRGALDMDFLSASGHSDQPCVADCRYAWLILTSP